MNLKLNNAITLTELLVASVILGIIALGIVSVDMAVRQSHQGTSRKAIIAMQTSAIMLHITKNAQLATGDGQKDAGGNFINLGIIVDDTTNTGNIWIRQEDPDPAPPPPDPNSYADDIWTSYTYDPNSHIISFCRVLDSTTTCPPNSENLGTLASLSAQMVADDTLGNQDLYFEVTLTNRFDLGAPINTFENPSHTLTSRVYPFSSSFNN